MKIQDLHQMQLWNDELENESIRILNFCSDANIMPRHFPINIEQIKVDSDAVYIYGRHRSDWDLESYCLPFRLFVASDNDIKAFWQKKSDERKSQEENSRKLDLKAEKTEYLRLKKKFEKENKNV